jgi:uncharacterized protein (TIGR03067 family)
MLESPLSPVSSLTESPLQRQVVDRRSEIELVAISAAFAMKLIQRTTTTIVAVLLTGTAAWCSDATQKDLEKIQGTWEASALTFGGKSFPPPLKDFARTFSGDGLITMNGQIAVQEATFKLDATKEHKHIDMTDKKDGKTLRGLYVLDGDTLKIAYNLEGSERPTTFAAKDIVIETFKRKTKN